MTALLKYAPLFARLVRLPNLLIVVFTQYLLEYLILVPALQIAGYSYVLDDFRFALLSFVTVLIAAAGYVINDIEDYEIDQLNKPEKVVVGKFLSVKKAQQLYWFLVILGMAISIYLAIYVQNFLLFFIYPAAVFLLWWYSKQLKKVALWGNVVVSVFCAFVAGIVLFAERIAFLKLIQSHTEIGERIAIIFGVYLAFAYASTMFREIVKDIEDQEGDAALGCQTLPILLGQERAKIIAGFFGISLLILLGFYGFWLFVNGEIWGVNFLVVAIVLPILIALFKLKNAQTKVEFHALSRLAKVVMLGGIFLLLISKI
ncbi:MAG: 4-hydroxybenzoate polyprenyltransferase [Paraglaciecola sp.]|jgi:4-hydroxybenzoate polyprenyltransferase